MMQVTAGCPLEQTDRPPETLLVSGRVLAEQPRRVAINRCQAVGTFRRNRESGGSEKTPRLFREKENLSREVDIKTLMLTRGASSPECAEKRYLKNSGRNPLGRVSETTGVSGTSAELIRRPFLRSLILWKPEIRRREQRRHLFSGKYRIVILP